MANVPWMSFIEGQRPVEILCLSTLLSNALQEALSPATDRRVRELLARVPTCPSGAAIEFEGPVTEKVEKKRGKRAPSAYNLFIGDCLKRGDTLKGQAFGTAASRMKQCALEWEAMKKGDESCLKKRRSLS